MTLPLRIVVKTSTAWETMTPESFRAQKDPKTPSEFIRISRDLLPLWEQATGLSYFKYRAALRDVCQKALEATGIPVTVGIENIDWEGPDEGLIAIDDDDVILESAKTLGEHFNESVNLIVWNRTTNYLGKQALENPRYGGLLDTCNWAVKKSFLKPAHIAEREYILARHWTAAGRMAPLFGIKRDNSLMAMAKRSVNINLEGLLNHPTILRLAETHSIYYLHSASISFLAHKMPSVSKPVEYLKTLPLHPLYESTVQ